MKYSGDLSSSAKFAIFNVDVLVNKKIVSSKSDFRRLVVERAITHMDTREKIKDSQRKAEKGVYRIGKKRFIKIV